MEQSPKEKRARIPAIVLAAGRSSRLRRPKQLLPFRGVTLLRHVTMTAMYSQCSKVIVVVGAFHLRIKSEIKFLDVTVVKNSLWPNGMGGSLKVGIEHATKNAADDADGYLVLLCDQPFINEDYIDQMIDAFEKSEHKIVASRFADTLGVPAIFGKQYIEELMAIDDKHGVKVFLERYRDKLVLLDFVGGEVDVDTPMDLERLRSIDMEFQPHLSRG